MYFLWHLTHETWFRQHLPAFTDFPSLSRLTSMLISYNLTLEELYVSNKSTWRSAVKDAVLAKAKVYYEPKQTVHASRIPNFSFVYLGQPYLYHQLTTELAEVAVLVRADRLPGVPEPYRYHKCPWCHQNSSLHGKHLLQCHQLPTHLMQERCNLYQAAGQPNTPINETTTKLLACATPKKSNLTSTDPQAVLTRKTLLFFRKVHRAVVASFKSCSSDLSSVESSLIELFGEDDPSLGQVQEAVINDRVLLE